MLKHSPKTKNINNGPPLAKAHGAHWLTAEQGRMLNLPPILWIGFIAIFTAWLSGCTTIAPSALPTQISWKDRQVALNRIQSWQISGKIAIQTAQDSGSATVDWTQNEGQYLFVLLGPVGTGGFKLIGQTRRVTLETSDGKRYSATNAEQLLAQQWGYRLPISNLNYWVRGLPVPGIAYNSRFDAYNRLLALVQQGWEVQYLSYTHAGLIDLPNRISINSPSLKTKLVIYEWKVGNT